MNRFDFCPGFEDWINEGRLVTSYDKNNKHVTCFLKGIRVRLESGSIKALFGRAQNREDALRSLADHVATARELGVLEIR